MAYYFCPVGNSPWVDSNGDPLVGGYWSFYLAGTSTPVAVYTDNTGTVAQPADLTLQSNGMPFSPIWLQGGIAVKARLFTSAGVAVANGTFDNISGIDDPAIASAVDQWVPYTAPVTYISATSFSVGGDQTNDFQVRRRVRSSNTGGTIYSTITASSFSAGATTVTVVNDSGTLDAGLSAVSYGLISSVNSALPMVQGSFTPTVEGTSIAGSGTYSQRVGLYARIGNLVFIDILLTWSAHTGTGNMIITGLPFSCTQNASLSIFPGNLAMQAAKILVCQAGGTSITFNLLDQATGAPAVFPIDSAAGQVTITGAYLAA